MALDPHVPRVMTMARLLVLLCAAALAACGAEVKARETPTFDQLQAPVGEAGPPSADGEGPALPALVGGASTSGVTGVTGVTGEINVPALIYSDLDAELAARATGVVTAIRVDLGDAVRAGQVLALLDDSREAARLEAATATLERARTDHVRMQSLQEGGFVTAQELDATRHELRTAEAALRVAQVELDHTRVVAPFAGVVTRRHAGLGRPVREGDPLFRVTALQPLRAIARLPERQARGLHRGMVASLVNDDGVQVEAIIVRIAPAVEPGSGTVEVLFTVHRRGPFLPGSSAILRLVLPLAAAADCCP
jgi:membrane fusion protein, multidrug efflux system